MEWYDYITWYMVLNLVGYSIVLLELRFTKPDLFALLGAQLKDLEEAWPWGKASHTAMVIFLLSILLLPLSLVVLFNKIKGGK